MKKKIRLLGLEIDNYPLREELQKAESFYHSDQRQVIKTITMETLALVNTDDLVRESIEKASLVVADDKEILTEARIESGQRIWEVREHLFIREFLKRANKNRRSLFLLSETEDGLLRLQAKLSEAYPKIHLLEAYSLESCGEDYDVVVNEINASMPQLVLSVLPSPLEEQFLAETAAKLGVGIWYSVGNKILSFSQKTTPWVRIREIIHAERFKNAVQKYDDK